MATETGRVIVIDDKAEILTPLVAGLKEKLPSVEFEAWRPTRADNPRIKLNELVAPDTALVVTDYDLTTGVRGLFGIAIIAWCQAKAIPVGEYSRAHIHELPGDPNLFELRVPRDNDKAVLFIANIYEGFRQLREAIGEHSESGLAGVGLAELLARVLGRPELESQFSAYMARLDVANAYLLHGIRESIRQGTMDFAEDKKRLVTYIVGHMLVNAILKYPGPIISGRALCAYLGVHESALPQVRPLFRRARYLGPFGCDDEFYWSEDVDDRIESLATEGDDAISQDIGEYHRSIVERELKAKLQRHSCDRCDGKKGGFWCPFSARAVCEDKECSVPGCTWVPLGARLSRVERDFYDEWAPVMGL